MNDWHVQVWQTVVFLRIYEVVLTAQSRSEVISRLIGALVETCNLVIHFHEKHVLTAELIQNLVSPFVLNAPHDVFFAVILRTLGFNKLLHKSKALIPHPDD